MSPGILGKKIGMTQMFRPDGQAVPVTLLKAGPCMVVQRKTPTTDGYDAVQLGLMEFIKPARINKPCTAHLKKAGVEVKLEVIHGNGHGGPGFATAESRKMIESFFDKHLKAAAK